MSSKQWLWKHGLIAKKLTLLDALAPTFVPHKAKYVPILDKHVLSKVFDEVCTFFYTKVIFRFICIQPGFGSHLHRGNSLGKIQ